MKFRRVIVVGLDGLEPRIVERLRAAGQLPNLQRLAQLGGYSPVRTTYPAQTPVAWSTFATGLNPGGHGIFDFIRRNPTTYLPDFALNRYEPEKAFRPPRAVNLRRGKTIWDLLGAAGIPSTILRMPCTFPPDPLNGRMLAGMGVPDLRGGQGTSTFYSSAADLAPRESEQIVRLQSGAGTLRTHIIGPRNPKSRDSFLFAIELAVQPDRHRLVIRSQGAPKELEIPEGSWSGWLRVRFKTGLLRAIRGMVRFHLVRLDPLELYASSVNFDPEAPLFPISYPAGYARELGTFYTTGMVEDHAGLNNERISEEAYLDQCGQVMVERERMLHFELDRFDRGFLFCLFDTPDRLQHMFWRCQEPAHPANTGPAARDLAMVIDNHYRDCDAVVGRLLARTDDETLLIVLSDHGMTSFRRGVHLNTWLYEHGFLALKNHVRPGQDAGRFLRSVDWDRTLAYAVGLAGIYINQRGREERGSVPPEEVPSVKDRIAAALAGFTDPATGRAAIRSVAAREQLYRGPYANEAPDLIVNYAPGYRVSWSASLGGIAEGLVEDNTRKWSGDHIVDPEAVPGVLFTNRPFRSGSPALTDLAPTILGALGVPPEEAMEGGSLLE